MTDKPTKQKDYTSPALAGAGDYNNRLPYRRFGAYNNKSPFVSLDFETILSYYCFLGYRNIPNGGERMLLQSSKARCSDPFSYFEHTSYLGAVSELQEDDQIFVKVNNLTSVVEDPKTTYFGLYLIDPVDKGLT